MTRAGQLKAVPLNSMVAAVSVGIVYGESRLDLEYAEDSVAEVDLNLVMNDRQAFIEIQGTAEERPFDRSRLDELLFLGELGIEQLFAEQRKALNLN
jgi:ribonuclease PH